MSTDPRLPDLFGQAAELPAEQRDAWLADLRVRDPALAAEVADLLAAAERPQRLLDSPDGPLAVASLAEAPADGDASTPERIGPYRIVREIGRGGMGRVFLAEEEGEHFRRRVALKVLERGELGVEAVRRFRDEVRILASLEHPGIARFLDGGRAADGAWFLALEYVEGAGLLEHARSRALGVADRLRLFLAVLDAVAYAHERLVVHRDLKPANVLVGADGMPRLLDFGISKLVAPEEGDDATQTRTELRAFTPAYASPEQFRGERATPASDVYSLGVVLYELLAGVRPYRTTSSSRVELERAVLEEDPEPPSTAARRAAARGQQPGGGSATAPLPLRLGADLDAICLRALRKEPRDRYRSVADFAADLRRHLGGLPVEARRGGARYRAGRFLARHRGRLGTGAALLLAIMALLYAARTQQRAADPAPAPRPAAAPPLVPKPFPFSPVNPPPVAELERRFTAAPASVEAGAALALGHLREGRLDEAGLVVSRMRQIPDRQNDPLTDYLDGHVAWRRQQRHRALVLMTRALDGAVAGGRGELVGHIRATRGRLLSTLGQRDMALREMSLARDHFERAGDRPSLLWVLNGLAIEEMHRGRLGEAERLFAAALAISLELSPAEHGAVFRSNLGGIALLRGRPDLAEPQYREALAAARATGRQHRIATSLAELSQALRDLGKVTEADAALDESIALIRQANDREGLTTKLLYRGEADLQAARLAGVPALADEIAAVAQETGDRFTLVKAAALRGQLAAVRGEVATARRQLGEASRLAKDNGDADTATALALWLAEMEHALGNGEEAARLIEQARSYQGGEHYEGVSELIGQLMLARVATAAGRLDEARSRLTAMTPRGEGAPSVEVRLTFLAAHAELASAEGRHAAARRDLEEAIAAADGAGRKVAELDLRLLLARLQHDGGDAIAARANARRVAAEAQRLGLLGFAKRARALAATWPASAG